MIVDTTLARGAIDAAGVQSSVQMADVATRLQQLRAAIEQITASDLFALDAAAFNALAALGGSAALARLYTFARRAHHQVAEEREGQRP